jgi:tetratricopeptide (TPR) repeat protein
MARTDIAPGDLVSAQLVLNKLQKAQTQKVALREEESLMLAQQQLSRGDRAGAFQTYVRAFARLDSKSGQDKAFEGIALIYPALPVKPSLPEEARRYLVQSRVHVEDKNITQAIDLYDKAIALAPWWPSSHFDRGLLLGQIGKNEEAIASMKRFLQLSPTSENARDGQDKIYEWELKLSQQQAARERREKSGGMSATLNQQANQSDCFIATAAYGSAMDPHVATLRYFRDTRLLTNAPGRWLVGRYYAWSPPAADFIRERDGLRAVVRVLLGPLVLAVLYPWQAMAIAGMALALAIIFWRRRAWYA